MDVKLTPQQSAALHAYVGPALPLIDEATSERYFLLSEPAFLHLQGLAQKQDATCQEQLRGLIDEGIESPSVTGKEAFTRLRRLAEQLGNRDA